MPTLAPVAQTTGSQVDRLDPWKEDGNIVLAAEGKYFRVHRSILSTYSEVFRDMFDCPHPNEVEKELVDLCPVVHLHDAATDVQIMLKALYDRSYPLPCFERMPISFVSVFLRLGEKYAIPGFIKEAKAKLCCAYEPTSISTASFITPRFPLDLFPAITDSDPYNFQLMNLLQEMGLKAPLPIAMYQCIASSPLTNIVDGYQANDSFHSLSPDNLRSFIRMKDVLENYRVQLAKILCPSSTCLLLNCKLNIRRLWSEDINVVPPFCLWRAGWDKLFCESCTSSLKAKREAEMNKAWNKMPSAFGFDSWVEVRKSGDFASYNSYVIRRVFINC
ncbi:hypothetical protein OG21DRAFT_1455124 [Imleria badia]|nr:hypothetical protein OG21DRAFT_1455124 [Imleria badia]